MRAARTRCVDPNLTISRSEDVRLASHHHIQRKPTAHAPTVWGRSGDEFAAESGGPLPHPDLALAAIVRTP
jgi:hypothetical protein